MQILGPRVRTLITDMLDGTLLYDVIEEVSALLVDPPVCKKKMFFD